MGCIMHSHVAILILFDAGRMVKKGEYRTFWIYAE